MGDDTDTVTITLNARELALIRVACLQRLDRLRQRPNCESSYAETRALLETGGVLHQAMRAMLPRQ